MTDPLRMPGGPCPGVHQRWPSPRLPEGTRKTAALRLSFICDHLRRRGLFRLAQMVDDLTTDLLSSPDRTGNPMDEIDIDFSKPYRVLVLADDSGEWCGNALRYSNREDAETAARDLEWRWMAVRDWKVVKLRWAEVTPSASEKDVAQYLPKNYATRLVGDRLFIEGHDDHGWTLDGYVIPRLASALIATREVTS